MINRDKPTASCLLVSEPFMHDPNFIRSVVLLCQHDLEGTLGLVLNHRTNLLLKDLIDCPLGDFPVYLGGPVGMEGLQFIHTFPEKIDGGISLGNDLYWEGTLNGLRN